MDELHGHTITDNYRWLESSDDRVAAWTDAQNAYTRTVLEASPRRSAVEAKLKPLMEIGAVTAPAGRGSRYF